MGFSNCYSSIEWDTRSRRLPGFIDYPGCLYTNKTNPPTPHNWHPGALNITRWIWCFWRQLANIWGKVFIRYHSKLQRDYQLSKGIQILERSHSPETSAGELPRGWRSHYVKRKNRPGSRGGHNRDYTVNQRGNRSGPTDVTYLNIPRRKYGQGTRRISEIWKIYAKEKLMDNGYLQGFINYSSEKEAAAALQHESPLYKARYTKFLSKTKNYPPPPYSERIKNGCCIVFVGGVSIVTNGRNTSPDAA